MTSACLHLPQIPGTGNEKKTLNLERWMRSVTRSIFLAAMFVEAGTELLLTRPSTRAKRADWLHRFCARAMRRMNITVTVHGTFPESGSVITNHQTYLDIITLASIRPCVFVSKSEVVNVPVIGWMTTMSGTVFVERGRGGSALRAGPAMKAVSDEHLPVVFFPEGTTGVGDELAMPFRSGLLAQAIEAGAPITASFITYSLAPRDIAAGKTLRNDVHWGPQSLLQQIWNFLSLHGLHATTQFAEGPIAFTDAAIANRKIAANEAREAVIRLSAAPASWPVPQS